MDLRNVQILQRVPLEARAGGPGDGETPASKVAGRDDQQQSSTSTTVLHKTSTVFVTAPRSSSPSSSSGPTSTSPVPSSSSSPSASDAKPTGLPNLNISNGTCYYAPGKPMDSRFIPCGNSAAEIQSCCWEGDNCLADHACFGIHDKSYITYLAGCTDSGGWNMSDPGVKAACPAKPAPYDSQPWVGLVYCGSNSTGNNEWIGCPQPGQPMTMTTAGDCACPSITQQRIVAFQDGPTLSSYASLPTSSGGSIMWFPPYSPTYAVTATEAPAREGTTTTSIGSTNSSTAGSASQTSLPSTPSSPPSHKNTGLIAGVTVGVVGAVILALVGAFFFVRKRKRAQAAGQFGDAGLDGSNGNGNGYGNGLSPYTADEKMVGTSPSPGIAQSTTMSELDIQPARPWSLRSELDGTSTPPPGAVAANSNLAARDSIGTLLTSPPTSPTPGSVLYESSTVSSLHGQLTGQTTGGQTNASGGTGNGTRSQHPGASNFETLVELEG